MPPLIGVAGKPGGGHHRRQPLAAPVPFSSFGAWIKGGRGGVVVRFGDRTDRIDGAAHGQGLAGGIGKH